MVWLPYSEQNVTLSRNGQNGKHSASVATDQSETRHQESALRSVIRNASIVNDLRNVERNIAQCKPMERGMSTSSSDRVCIQCRRPVFGESRVCKCLSGFVTGIIRDAVTGRNRHMTVADLDAETVEVHCNDDDGCGD